MQNNYIIPFKKLNKNSILEAGGKGASLGEMLKYRFLVPDGFVISAKAFEKYIEDNDINAEIDKFLAKINLKDMESVEEASEVIMSLVKEGEINKELEKQILAMFKEQEMCSVAVRSSATAEDSKIDSWAGELESYLDVTKQDLIQKVKFCWASLFTPRAIFYRLERKLGGKKVMVAVVVQKMVQSKVSGVAFSVHPVTKDKNQMIIEAGFGLGEAIVAGKITPDTYVIDKRNFMVLDKNISEQRIMIVRDEIVATKAQKLAKAQKNTVEVGVPKFKMGKQKLSDVKIVELAKIVKNIEKHYKQPMDIEWALEKNKLYLVQARPITTLT